MYNVILKKPFFLDRVLCQLFALFGYIFSSLNFSFCRRSWLGAYLPCCLARSLVITSCPPTTPPLSRGRWASPHIRPSPFYPPSPCSPSSTLSESCYLVIFVMILPEFCPVLWIQYIEFGSGSRAFDQFGSGSTAYQFWRKKIILEKANFL